MKFRRNIVLGMIIGAKYRLEDLKANIVIKKFDLENDRFISDYYYDRGKITRNGHDSINYIRNNAVLISKY